MGDFVNRWYEWSKEHPVEPVVVKNSSGPLCSNCNGEGYRVTLKKDMGYQKCDVCGGKGRIINDN